MILFNKPTLLGEELVAIQEAIGLGKISGDGKFTQHCNSLLEKKFGIKKALLTHSCTAALEMSALLLDLETDDEIICPSYTFVTTASAFALRGAKLVFVDIKSDTLNIDENKIEEAITSKTKAIVVVHYAGVSCNMDAILKIAKEYNLAVVEDAAQAIGSYYKGKACGSIGDLGCYSFHETKNIVSGEGGALLINKECFIDRAEIIREKGTNRSKFFRGQVDKYTWVDLGSSYLPSELIAAYLSPQLDNIEKINNQRLRIWNRYHNALLKYEQKGIIRRPIIPTECTHNAHMYYILFNDLENRTRFIDFMKNNNILCVFHYIPLHSSPAGLKFGRVVGKMENTNYAADCLVRLPLYYSLSDDNQEFILNKIDNFFENI